MDSRQNNIISDNESVVATARKRVTEDSDMNCCDAKRRKGLDGNPIACLNDFIEVNSRRSVKRPMTEDDDDHQYGYLSLSPGNKKRRTIEQDEDDEGDDFTSAPMINVAPIQELSIAFPILTDYDLIMLAYWTSLPVDETQCAASSEIDSHRGPIIDAELSLAQFQTLAPLEPVPISNNENCGDDRCSLSDAETSSSEEDESYYPYSERRKSVTTNKQTKKKNVKYLVNKIKSRRLKPAAKRGRRPNNKRPPTAQDFEYLVSWVGYSKADDSWEPFKNVKHLLNTSKDDVTRTNVFEVDEIKSRRLKKTFNHQRSPNYLPTDGDFDYLVSWVGYSDKHDTWEPYESIKHLKEDIRAVS
jgi:hypothetical protein